MIESLSILAAILNIAGWSIYLYHSWSATTRSSPVSWLLSLLLVINVSVTGYLGSGSLYSVAMYIAGAIPCVLAFAFAARNSGFDTSRGTAIKLLLGVLLLVMIWVHKDPLISAVLISLYYGFSYTNMIHSMIQRKSVETPLPWGVWTAAAIAQCVAVANEGIAVWLIPATNLASWLLVFLCSIYLRENQRNPGYTLR